MIFPFRGSRLALGVIALLVPAAGRAQLHGRDVLPTSIRAAPGVRFSSRVETYDVFGTTLPELRRDLIAKRVRTSRGTRHAAMTTWDLRWRYASGRQTGFGCSPVGVDVSLELVLTVPRWPDSTRAESADALRSEWARFRNALLVHEANHSDVTIAEVNRLAERLRQMQVAACSALEGEMRHAADRSIGLIRLRNDDYDQRTQHGRTEGAVLGTLSSR